MRMAGSQGGGQHGAEPTRDRQGYHEPEKRPGSLPAFITSIASVSVRSALRRRGRPRLDQGVVVDGFALRLLVRQLALGRDVAVLGRLGEPVLSRLLLVELRSASALHAGFLQTFHYRVLG